MAPELVTSASWHRLSLHFSKKDIGVFSIEAEGTPYFNPVVVAQYSSKQSGGVCED